MSSTPSASRWDVLEKATGPGTAEAGRCGAGAGARHALHARPARARDGLQHAAFLPRHRPLFRRIGAAALFVQLARMAGARRARVSARCSRSRPKARRRRSAKLRSSARGSGWTMMRRCRSVPDCHGQRLNPLARAVRLPLGRGAQAHGGFTIGEIGALSINEAVALFPHGQAEGPRGADRARHLAGDHPAARIFGAGGARLSLARPRGDDTFRRRIAAHPARGAIRLRVAGRALCARRADHRPASARQCAAA